MSLEAPQIPSAGATETINGVLSFSDRLDVGELLTGTPLVVELGTADLTIDQKRVNTVALTVNGVTVPIGEAVQFRCTGMLAGTTYRVRATCGTNATPAQTRVGIVRLVTVDDSV